MKPLFHHCVASAFAALAVAAPCGAHAQVDLSKSSITAVSKQMNVPIEGVFKKFSARVSFDPAKPASGSAQIAVDVGSYDLGDPSYDSQVVGKDWFDARRYPTATFVSSAIAAAGSNRYDVTGKLTIKGKSALVVVPVTFTQRENAQALDGTLPIKRSQFNIGTGEWKDTSIVADEVSIKFHLVAAKF
ncbi:MAG: YceI family protein [Trinickia sp.]|jgi:polyisoprenoid-binding protein YceI|uniref:YceI family protein n=1 Tax=Trinickia sp. TaxID=2571163 RepID=UPI003F7CE65D